ncbi:MAG TPA: ATP-binding cassette domain-containing protein, partial [Thermodesulfobacteriota bacterium]|nr:ATP-binding cassette domain-containing protein [Thermodesulfobacteriota bacterium]
RSLLEELRIAHLAKQKAFSLSGGERRRVEISRSLVTSPRFILLDEPFAGIDPLAVLDIQNIISQLKAKGIGVVISDHNVRETLGVCDQAYILSGGRILEKGTPGEIAASRKAREIYLGENFQLN